MTGRSNFLYKSIVNLPTVPKTVNPEVILIGNPASNRLKLWVPDKDIRGMTIFIAEE